MKYLSAQLEDRLSRDEINISVSLLDRFNQTIRDLNPNRRIDTILDKIFNQENYLIISIGKNAAKQVDAFVKKLDGKNLKIIIHQIENYTDVNPSLNREWRFVQLPHPIPNEATFNATEISLEEIASVSSEYYAHVFISGGGSAAFALPEKSVGHERYLKIVKTAIAKGFDIRDLNYLRALIDRVKGGKLLEYLDFQKVYSWISSDVVSDDARIVASGPTVPGIEGSPKVNSWIEKTLRNWDINYKELKEKLEKNKQQYLLKKEKFHHEIITSRKDLLRIFENYLEKNGYNPIIVDDELTSSIEKVIENIITEIRNTDKKKQHILIWSGEPTIEITQKALSTGQGGRISSLCCLVTEKLNKLDKNVIFMGIATDGKDGSSPHPGYLVTKETASHLRPLGGAKAIIRQGNAGKVLSSIGNGISIGKTDINLLDLYLAYVY